MNRRSFMAMFAALPVVGKYWKPETDQRVANSLLFHRDYPVTDLDYLKSWMNEHLDDAINNAQYEAQQLWGFKAPLFWDDKRQAYTRFLRRDATRLPV